MTAAAWNAAYPVGAKVRFWPVIRADGSRPLPPLYTETRSEAWVLPSGDAVVLVNGKSGGVAISHVEVL